MKEQKQNIEALPFSTAWQAVEYGHENAMVNESLLLKARCAATTGF